MESTTTTELKKRLRREISLWEAAQEERSLRESDAALFRRFLSLPQVERCETLLLFWGVGAEPDTGTLVQSLTQRGRRVALPRCLRGGGLEFRLFQGREEMTPNRFGIPEPSDQCPVVAPCEAQLALIPAMCYDKRGMRLGRGGGYYDRFLAGFSGLSVGLCRDALLRQSLPTQPHDMGVSLVVTQSSVICPAAPSAVGQERRKES